MNIFIDQLLSLNFAPLFIAGVFKQFAFTPKLFHFRHFVHSSKKVAYWFFGTKRLEPENFINGTASNYTQYE